MRILQTLPAEKARAIKTNIYFDHLDEAGIQQVSETLSLREFERGETLFLEGDPCAGLHIVQSGCVKIYRLSPQGRQYIVRLAQEGDTFNEVSVFDGGGNPVHADALELTRVWVVEAGPLREMIRSNPDFAQKVISNFGQNLRRLVQAASEMAFYQVTHRLARLIAATHNEKSVRDGPGRWTQEQLAAHLGTVREVVARSLRELERSGAIRTDNRRITISDERLLDQWIQGPWN